MNNYEFLLQGRKKPTETPVVTTTVPTTPTPPLVKDQPAQPTPKQVTAKNRTTVKPQQTVKPSSLLAPETILRQNKPTQRTTDQTTGNTRVITRHSFDVRLDQIVTLDALVNQLFRSTGKKPKLGRLFQEALDDLFKKYHI